MKINEKVQRKSANACDLVLRCTSPSGMGIWASCERYAHQIWTRDFVLAAAQALLLIGRRDVVATQIGELAKRQRADGKIPILFLDDERAFLFDKISRSIKSGRWSFMLRRYFEDGGVENLSPWTKDSEVLFAICVHEHVHVAKDERFARAAAERAMDYVRMNLMKDGFILGSDWRDTNTWLKSSALLSNNCLLYRALKSSGRCDEAEELRNRINEAFWTGTGYRDYLGVESADAFGQALGVIHGVIPESRYPAILDSFASLHTVRGYLSNDCRPNPTTSAERKLLRLKRMKRSFVIWPFIHGYVILVLLRMGERELAEQAFREYTNMRGFWEYYDPKTGRGYGDKDQLWSAALYLRAASALGNAH